MRPTITNLLGIEDDNPIQFGHDLLDEDRRQLMITRDGNFADEEYVGIQGACYDRETGETVENGACDTGFDAAQEELETSDSIIYGDLLRYLDETEMVNPEEEQEEAA
ncbi:yqgS family protein [Halobacillus sp. BAB-2008]|nr:yqgS family protein [Halobacillus sp. BAB-2008]